MKFTKVIYEKDRANKAIARITLNCPDKLNVWQFKGGMTDEFYAALEQAEEDDDIKVVIIKGAGRAFSAGHDLTEVGFVYGMGTGQPGERRPSQRIRLKLDRLWMWKNLPRVLYCSKVTIAQVHGYCIGEGLVVSNLCDITIAAEDAHLAHAEQRLGFSGSGLPLAQLYLSVGMKRARELLLTGRAVSGVEAERIGLVNKVVPADKLEEETNKMAEAITLLPADGIAIGKAMTHLLLDRLGLTTSFILGYVGHTLFTNLRWEPDEYNFFKERKEKGPKAGFHGRDDRFAGKV